MIHRTIVTSFRLTALLCKWMITFILLLELTVLPHGMRALATGTVDSSTGTQPAARQRPLAKISLRPLDLSRVPTEQELKMAGQLGSPLTPSKSADPAKIADPVER